MPDWLQVTLLALATAIATGLGPLPFAFFKEIPERLLGHGDAIAAGLMLAASFRLINEGLGLGEYRTLAGVVVGLVFILVAKRWLSKTEPDITELQGAGARKALLFLGAMTLHSFAEGVSVGVSFGGGDAFGVFMSAAIAIHNIPEGIAIGVSLVPKGMSWWRASLWSIFSSLPQPLMALPAFLFVEWFEPALPFGLGLAAGAMIWMVFAELVHDAIERAGASSVATTVTIAAAAMVGAQVLLSV